MEDKHVITGAVLIIIIAALAFNFWRVTEQTTVTGQTALDTTKTAENATEESPAETTEETATKNASEAATENTITEQNTS